MRSIFISMAIILLSLSDITASAQFKNNVSLHNEHYRINNGIMSGQLTAREAARLKIQAANIRKQAFLYKMNNGRIGARERAHLRKEQRRLNRKIACQRHRRLARF